MNQLEQLQAHVADLTAAQADATAKVDVLVAQNDALITLTDSIAAKLASLGESGQIPPDALSALLTSIDGAKTAALAIGAKAADETAKVNTALEADAPPPAPAPAPAPDAGDGDTTDTPPAGDAAAESGSDAT